jgi:hypothetical protein
MLIRSQHFADWKAFDAETIRSVDPRGGRPDHAMSAVRNLLSGVTKILSAPFTPLSALVMTATLSESLSDVLKGLSLVVTWPVGLLLGGIKDIVVDAPLHGAAMLFGPRTGDGR